MPKKKHRSSIRLRVNFFIVLVILLVACEVTAISYIMNDYQIDNFCKRLAYNSAENFAATVDPEFLKEFRKVAESSEYQQIREKAAETENDQLIKDYLTEKGLWDQFESTQRSMCTYLENMDDIKYLYVIALGEKSARYDMYLIDDYDNHLTRIGFYDERDEDLINVDTTKYIEPSINNTNKWGYLCSAYAPVNDKAGKLVCHVGCDIDMESNVNERYQYLVYIGIATLILTTIVLIIAIVFVNKNFLNPLKQITKEAKKFEPGDDMTYDEAKVIKLNLKRNDEISDIYDVIRSTQTTIVDHLDDIAKLERDKERYQMMLRKFEEDIRNKNDKLEEISVEASTDELTQIGNKNAYNKRVDELKHKIDKGIARFAIVMIDLNNLKGVNDFCGHKAGDVYIKGSCDIIHNVFKHSQIYRIGGDEFVVILTGIDYQNMDKLFNAAKDDFTKSFSDASQAPYHRYSASLGIGVYEKGDTYDSVFRRADQQMYNDKMEFKKKHGSYR